MASHAQSDVRVIGRYALHDEIASGGMATVHLGRLLGEAGFSRTVAIKRLHAQFAKDPDFVDMFIDEARLAARIHHPNVVSTLDVVARDRELFLVMEYIPGEALSRLYRTVVNRGELIDPRISVAVVAGFLHGLHAAHEARNEKGEPLDLVHRDVSPQNVLVGVDGIPRVVDFGVAKAAGRLQTTREGQLKGKLPYMAPEQVQGHEATRRSDVFAAAIVLWEMLTGRRLFDRPTEAAVMMAVLSADPPAPSSVLPGLSKELDRIALRGLARSPDDRYPTARAMALDLEAAIDLALPSEVGAWVQANAGTMLDARASRVAQVESASGVEAPPRSDRQAPETVSRTAMTAASTDSDLSARRPRGKLRLTVGISITLAALAIFLLALRRPAAATDAAPSSEPSTSAAASSDPPPPLPVSDPTTSAVAVATAPATATAAAPTATHATTTTSAAKRPAASNKCNPPYRLDAAGRKIFKLECL
jgi:serine/threonine-protein kinase